MNMKGICAVVAERLAREYNAGFGKSLVLPVVRARLCREIPTFAALHEREQTDILKIAAVLENVSLVP